MPKTPDSKEKQNAPQATTVEVALPSIIQIELVQGNELRHYEIFFSLATVALSTAVGFWTGYVTAGTVSKALFWSVAAFTGLTLFSGCFAFYYRQKMNNGKVKKVASLDKFD